MGMKKAIISLSIIALLSICMFNGVAAAPVSKHPTDVHSNYAGDLRGIKQTYLLAKFRGEVTAVTMGVGQYTYLDGVLASVTPPTSSQDFSHGIPNATVNIQSLNSDGKTWTTVATKTTWSTIPPSIYNPELNVMGEFMVKLTPTAAGVYTYRVTYDGDSQYAPAVSNVITLTVTNMVIS